MGKDAMGKDAMRKIFPPHAQESEQTCGRKENAPSLQAEILRQKSAFKAFTLYK